MSIIRNYLLGAALVFMLFGAFQQSARAFETGGDFSELTWEQTTEGVVYTDPNGNVIDPIAYAAANHWTCIRLRLLVDGGGSGTVLEQTLPYDLALATRIHAAGMHILLDIFYSNNWCDAAQQTTPPEWANDSYAQLKAQVQSYTASVITAFDNNGTPPTYVQIGNEISNGMLWPVGSLSNQSQFIGLINAGIAGVKQVSSTPKIILQCPGGNSPSLVEWFFNTIASNCKYDIVGLSYYPAVGTDLSDITSAMTTYEGMFGSRPIMLVEFSYPYEDSPDWEGSTGYWTTPSGQSSIVWYLCQDMRSYSQGAGVIYWGALYVNWGWDSLINVNYVNGVPSNYAEPAWSSLWAQ